MRHSPTDLPSLVEILEARLAPSTRADADVERGDPQLLAQPRRTGRHDDRPAGRMTLSPVE